MFMVLIILESRPINILIHIKYRSVFFKYFRIPKLVIIRILIIDIAIQMIAPCQVRRNGLFLIIFDDFVKRLVFDSFWIYGITIKFKRIAFEKIPFAAETNHVHSPCTVGLAEPTFIFIIPFAFEISKRCKFLMRYLMSFCFATDNYIGFKK